MNTKGMCVCEICTCGRHRCPHNRSSIGSQPIKAECHLSEYQFSFTKNPTFVAPRVSMKPADRQQTLNVPLETESSYMRTYTPHPNAELATSAKAKTGFKPPTEAMDLASSYKEDFQAKEGKRSKSFKPENAYSQDATKVQSKTIYAMSYTAPNVKDPSWHRATPIKHQESLKTRGSAMFDSRTTMKEDYKLHGKTYSAKMIIPETETKISKDKFDANSTYKEEYTPKKVEHVKSAKPKENRSKSSTFFGESTMKAAYKAVPVGQKTKSFKPNDEYKPCETKFETETSYSGAYKEQVVRKQETPLWAKRQIYEVPSVRFNVTSSYQDAFKKPKMLSISRPAPDNHKLELSHGDNSYPSRTQYQTEFVPYDNKLPSKSFKKIQNYEHPKETMEGSSEYQTKYTGKMAERVHPCIPVPNKINPDNQNQSSTTTYNNTYTGQHRDCLAKEFITVNEGSKLAVASKRDDFKFLKFKNGHYYFGQDQASSHVNKENVQLRKNRSKSAVPFMEVSHIAADDKQSKTI